MSGTLRAPRRVIFFARYEASEFGSPFIETEYLLLGLFREDKALTDRLLRSNAAVESIVNQIEAHTVIREKVTTSHELPLGNECQRVLAYAAEEAEMLSDKHIGTEHLLLLSVLGEQKSFAAQLLNERGVLLATAHSLIASQPTLLRVSAEGTSHELFYNPASETLILERRNSVGPHSLPTRLLVRHKDAADYEASWRSGATYVIRISRDVRKASHCPIQLERVGPSRAAGLGWN